MAVMCCGFINGAPGGSGLDAARYLNESDTTKTFSARMLSGETIDLPPDFSDPQMRNCRKFAVKTNG